MEGETVILAAAVFADGRKADKQSLDGLKKTRLKFQQKRREQKPKNGGQQ